MRPPSIVMFERLFLAALALGVVGFALNYQVTMDQLSREPGMQQLGLGGGFVTGLMAVGTAIYLLLWYLIARRASNIAKWVLAVLVGLGVLFALPALGRSWNTAMMLDLVYYALTVAAVIYLFRGDAKAWLKGEWNAEPNTLD